MGKRENPHSDQDERETERLRERERASSQQSEFSPPLPPFLPALPPSRCLPVHHYRHQRGEYVREGSDGLTLGGTSRSLVTPTGAGAA